MAKSIMIQGTMSGVGKSLITAGLCRIFKQDGYLVAPFKSQNMDVHSHITSEGLEIGRAQAIKAYQKLDAVYDIIVIEGAGSPAEMHRTQKDIANMGFAEMVDAPVLLVGDIDRGGVFAQLLGTLLLLGDAEYDRVQGLIVNKFRGDKSILAPGIRMLEERSGKPVLGVTPYIQIDLEEDSLSSQLLFPGNNSKQVIVTITVIRLPRICNYSDFQVLESNPLIHLEYVTRAEDLGMPDMVILPGTKNTMADLKWLRESGLEDALLGCYQNGVVIMGICGGYQMLGQTLSDPMFTEEGGKVRGIGILPVDTVFDNMKTRARVQGTFAKLQGPLQSLSGMPLEGYEIHMGHTTPVPGLVWLRSDISADNRFADLKVEQTFRQRKDGWQQEQVYGTNVHGIFDGAGIVEALVCALTAKRGIQAEPLSAKRQKENREKQFDKLADMLREHLDMQAIYRILG